MMPAMDPGATLGIAATFAVAAFSLSSYQILGHLTHYEKPVLQRCPGALPPPPFPSPAFLFASVLSLPPPRLLADALPHVPPVPGPVLVPAPVPGPVLAASDVESMVVVTPDELM